MRNSVNLITLFISQVGYYRTRYPASMLAQLVTAIRDGSLPPLDRLGLLDDCFALVQAGHTQTAEVIKNIMILKLMMLMYVYLKSKCDLFLFFTVSETY